MRSGLFNSSSPRFSRQWWLDLAGTGFWVGIATLLVWVYADTEFTQDAAVTMTVHLVTAEAGGEVLLSAPDTRMIFTVRGNRRRIDKFIRENNNKTIQYNVSKLGAGRNQSIRAVEIFEDDPQRARSGVSFRSAVPPAIRGIHIDEMIRRELPVKFSGPGAVLKKEPVLEPVWVRVARSGWKEILEKTGGEPVLLAVAKLEEAERGKPVDVIAEITPAVAGIPVQPEKKSVTVRVEIRKLVDTRQLPVPVRIVTPYTWLEDGTWDSHKLTREDQETNWVPQIEVTGAPEVLDALKSDQIDAYILLKDDDKKQTLSWLKREVKFRYASDLKVKIIGQYFVKFRLEPRTAPPKPP
jgi:hypothetical protein